MHRPGKRKRSTLPPFPPTTPLFPFRSPDHSLFGGLRRAHRTVRDPLSVNRRSPTRLPGRGERGRRIYRPASQRFLWREKESAASGGGRGSMCVSVVPPPRKTAMGPTKEPTNCVARPLSGYLSVLPSLPMLSGFLLCLAFVAPRHSSRLSLLLFRGKIVSAFSGGTSSHSPSAPLLLQPRRDGTREAALQKEPPALPLLLGLRVGSRSSHPLPAPTPCDHTVAPRSSAGGCRCIRRLQLAVLKGEPGRTRPRH
mmetsp:Transcript_34234/g.102486  ORF Transcript_34234/g.102486 Transcript_34234/m.102486 type:complete len:254 (+) Transcript_34234:620-1381(+)